MYLFSYGKSVSQIGCSGVVGQTGLLFTLASLPVPGVVVRPNFRCAFYLRPRAFHPDCAHIAAAGPTFYMLAG